MNILVIGNGFDLAHGLPTKYTDFLEFIKMIKLIKEQDIFNNEKSISEAGCNKENENLQKAIRLTILDKAKDNRLESDSKELIDCIDNNFWVNYFLQCPMYQKENWIDFESEISKIIRSIDNDLKSSNFAENSLVSICSNSFLAGEFLDDLNAREQERENMVYKEIEKIENDEGEKWPVQKVAMYINKYKSTHPIVKLKEPVTYKQMISKLEKDLNRLIRALEIYLVEYVNVIDCDILPDIKENCFDAVLSFNYTDTYMKLYDKEKKSDYDYIHGKADINHSIITNNMVLGIDEYLNEERRNTQVELIAFKKYYQRIHKGTGCKYREWIEEIQNEYRNIIQKENDCLEMKSNAMRDGGMIKADMWYKRSLVYAKKRKEMHTLHIFGHSLDVTDKDILRDLILNDNVKTTIYYNKKYYKDGSDDNGKNSLGEKISNLVKVIGQDELIKRTGGSTKTIEFKLQQDIIERV